MGGRDVRVVGGLQPGRPARPRTAGWCPRSPAGPTSSCSTRWWPAAMVEAGVADEPHRRRGRHRRSRAHRLAAGRRGRRPRRWRSSGTCRSSASTTSRPTSTPRSSRSPTLELPARGAAGVGRPHAARRDAGPRPATGCWARPSTTPPARPSTRWPASSASATPAARRSTGWRCDGDPTAIAFPRAMLHDGLRLQLQRPQDRRREPRPRAPGGVDRGRGGVSFQQAVVDVLVHKAQQGRGGRGREGPGPGRRCGRQLAAARRSCSTRAERDGVRCLLPSPAMCTDNAAMIAATAWYRLRSDGPSSLETGAVPNLHLPLSL